MRLKPRIFRKPQLTHPLARGLVGYWLHNEGSGLITNDLSGNGNYGFVSGATWVGEGLDFVGGSSQFVGDTQELIPFGTEQQTTLGAWMRTTIDGSTIAVLAMANTGSSNDWRALLIASGGFARASSRFNLAQANATGSTNIADGKWHFLVATFTTNTLRQIYVDGVLVNTNTAASGWDLTFNRWSIGRLPDLTPGSFFTGNVRSAFVLDRALSSGEIFRLYMDHYILFRQDPAWMGQAAVVADDIVILRRRRECA